MSDGDTDRVLDAERNVNGIHAHITTNDPVRHMVSHPALKGFGKYLLPWDNGKNDYDTPLNKVGSLLPYHNHVDPGIVVGAINYMIDAVNGGKTIFDDFYTEQQKQKDPTRKSTGLFFFRGKPGAPFAIVCPGGGFGLGVGTDAAGWIEYAIQFWKGHHG